MTQNMLNYYHNKNKIQKPTHIIMKKVIDDFDTKDKLVQDVPKSIEFYKNMNRNAPGGRNQIVFHKNDDIVTKRNDKKVIRMKDGVVAVDFCSHYPGIYLSDTLFPLGNFKPY